VAGLVSEIEAGNVRALVVMGGNPVTAFPDTARTRAALAALDTVAVVDVLPTETTEYATHLLPATDQLERADLTWLLDSYQLAVAAQYTDAVVPAVADRRPPWWMFASLARRLGFSVLPGDPDPDTIDDRTVLEPLVGRSRDGAALLAAPTAVVASGAVFGWVHDRVLPEGGWRLAPAPLLAQLTNLLTRTLTRPCVAEIPMADANDATSQETSAGLTLVVHRRLRMMNSQFRDIAAPGAAVEQPGVLAHPDVVAHLGGPGTAVVVTSEHGALDGTLVADDRLRPDVIAIAHGFGDENVSLLTSADNDIDPLTGMVHQSGLPVTIHALG
jgi:anaerobic selenocysteine-containing dehydrogenase